MCVEVPQTGMWFIGAVGFLMLAVAIEHVVYVLKCIIEYADDENRFVESDRHNGLIRAAHIKKSDAAHAKMVNTGEVKRTKYEALHKKIMESGIYSDLNKEDVPKFKAKMKKPDFLYNHYTNKNYVQEIRPNIKPVKPIKTNMHIKVNKKDRQCVDVTLFPMKLATTDFDEKNIVEMEDNRRAI